MIFLWFQIIKKLVKIVFRDIHCDIHCNIRSLMGSTWRYYRNLFLIQFLIMAVTIFTQLTGVWNGRYEAMGDVIAILCFRGLRGLSLRKVSFLTVAIYIAYTAETVFLCKVTIIFFKISLFLIYFKSHVPIIFINIKFSLFTLNGQCLRKSHFKIHFSYSHLLNSISLNYCAK